MTESTSEKKSTLLVLRSSPYGSARARAGIDLALASAAFDQHPTLLFMDEGVWQLLPDQDCSAQGEKNLAKLLASLPLYDIETLYVEETSLKNRQLGQEQLMENVKSVSASELPAFMESFDQLISL